MRNTYMINSMGREKERGSKRNPDDLIYWANTLGPLLISTVHSVQGHTHTRTHTRWTFRRWTVTWKPHIKIHTQASGLFTVQSILTCKRARQAVLNKQSHSESWYQSVANPKTLDRLKWECIIKLYTLLKLLYMRFLKLLQYETSICYGMMLYWLENKVTLILVTPTQVCEEMKRMTHHTYSTVYCSQSHSLSVSQTFN